MKALLLLFFILIVTPICRRRIQHLSLLKQERESRMFLTEADIYYYPRFIYSKVFFKDGKVADPYMNYNRLYDQMLFITEKGDTLALTDEKNIEFIVNDWDIFYYDEGYLRLIADDTLIKLAEKQVWVVADIRKMGTHNRPTTTVAITSLSTL